jgi:hypothetical protein
MAGVTVRLRAQPDSVQTDSQGRFTLTDLAPAFKVRLVAWADGYYISGRTIYPWDGAQELTLSPYVVPDNNLYEWIPPALIDRSIWQTLLIRFRLDPTASLAPDALFFKSANGLNLGCRDCHGEIIYNQWVSGLHPLGFGNLRFVSMYNGTDLSGKHQSPLTRFAYSQDYGRIPLRQDPTQSYFGPGYKLDFPASAGNCAACHLPAAALADPYGTDPNKVTGVNALGSHCDFCHKIAGVKLNPGNGLPYENMPGVLSLVMMRPSPEKQIFFGPYDDVDAGTDTYLPLERQSQYCAPCHNASFWGVPIYQSFAEWKASSYSDPVSGKTCQDCHMKPDGIANNFALGRAGLERETAEIFTHSFPGASSTDLIQNAVTMSVSARRNGDKLIVEVIILNDKTGHDVPTDSPLRQMILLVNATNRQGQALVLQDGPTVPEWGGVGDRARGYYAGLPGKGYAKILSELWTGITPTSTYWNPTSIQSDNRIQAFYTDTSVYTFAVPMDGKWSVEVSLLLRRAFKALMDQKSWEVPDIVMAHQTVIEK